MVFHGYPAAHCLMSLWPRTVELPLRWSTPCKDLQRNLGYTLRLAAENKKRASETVNPEWKRILLELAAGYSELAEQRANLIASK
jgi:hypothetical protein